MTATLLPSPCWLFGCLLKEEGAVRQRFNRGYQFGINERVPIAVYRLGCTTCEQLAGLLY